MNPEKIAELEKTLGVSQSTFTGSVQSGTALPASSTSAPKVDDIVQKLWKQRADSNAFALGCELLKSEDKPDLKQRSLLGHWFSSSSPLALAAGDFVRSGQPVDIVLQGLQGLHEKMVQSGLVWRVDWQYSILRILTRTCECLGVHSPQVIAIAQ
ncbi:hypothetical protein, partial [Sansalvadorimonas verongulae]|uniref:hypothetical protein n=1 Tax=Sansalvadorimonas verongulae TaxID=2172824 RepID=UPI001E61894B